MKVRALLKFWNEGQLVIPPAVVEVSEGLARMMKESGKVEFVSGEEIVATGEVLESTPINEETEHEASKAAESQSPEDVQGVD